MNFLLNRLGRYYFNRRVPSEFQEFDSRKLIRISLRTDSRKEAMRLAIVQNDQLENYWKELIQKGQKYEFSSYEKVVSAARLLGFSYRPNDQIAISSLEELFNRLITANDLKHDETKVTATLGGLKEPVLKIDDAIQSYVTYTKGKTLNKSSNQIRKWLNPRKLAMKTFAECIGNKDFSQINRDDLIKYRDWWINRIEQEEVSAGTANKNIIAVKTIIGTVNENLNLQLDTKLLFNKMLLPTDNQTRRLPFASEYIVSTLLNTHNLKGMNEQARWVLHAIAETGAGISEQCGLLPEDIILDCDIPHIIITPRHKKALKTKYRKRIIPLVGFALDAFKACPNGFTDYTDRPDSLSGALSKYLREHDLLPTDQHTVYSLRHSFQDRLLGVNAPDRVQADLMGHKFNRPSYGDGASLQQKLEWLKKIKLKRINILST